MSGWLATCNFGLVCNNSRRTVRRQFRTLRNSAVAHCVYSNVVCAVWSMQRWSQSAVNCQHAKSGPSVTCWSNEQSVCVCVCVCELFWPAVSKSLSEIKNQSYSLLCILAVLHLHQELTFCHESMSLCHLTGAVNQPVTSFTELCVIVVGVGSVSGC